MTNYLKFPASCKSEKMKDILVYKNTFFNSHWTFKRLKRQSLKI